MRKVKKSILKEFLTWYALPMLISLAMTYFVHKCSYPTISVHAVRYMIGLALLPLVNIGFSILSILLITFILVVKLPGLLGGLFL